MARLRTDTAQINAAGATTDSALQQLKHFISQGGSNMTFQTASTCMKAKC